MKTLSNKILCVLILAVAVTLPGCQNFEDHLTSSETEGGLVENRTPAVFYIIGDGRDYPVNVLIPQGDVLTTGVEIYASFTDALGTGEEVLVKEIPVTHTVNSAIVELSFNYEELRAATRRADGSELPADDAGLSIGDTWTLTFAGITNNGVFRNGAVTAVTVSTRFAGTYDLIEFDYWRNTGSGPVDENQFDGLWLPTFTVESIDLTTYRMSGVALWSDQEVYFQIDDATGEITYPEFEPDGTTVQLLNTAELTTCIDDPGDLQNVPCGSSDIAVKDEVDGKDRLSMVFGYVTSGPREFYHLIQKQVD